MLDQVTYETMKDQVGTTFQVRAGDQTFDFVLVKALKVMESEAARLKRSAFSLHFRGPAAPLIPQQILNVRHPSFGDEEQEVFFVPISREPAGYVYEAVFT